MPRLVLYASFLLAALALVGCDSGPKVSDLDIKPVLYKDVQAMLTPEQGPTVFVDVRSPKRFQQEHIAGAVNIPLPDIIANDPRLANAKNIIVYGAGVQDNLSRAAYKKMAALGYANLNDFRGGLDIWKSEGGKLEGTGPATQPATKPK